MSSVSNTDDILRLADLADRDGDAVLRDAMLTLAIAEAESIEPWVERCRARLVAVRPGHYLAQFGSVRQALDNPRVIQTFARIRAKYPIERVRWMKLRLEAGGGAYHSGAEPIGIVLERLIGPPAEADNVRRDSGHTAVAPLARPGQPMTRTRQASELAPLPSSVASIWSRAFPPANPGLAASQASPVSPEPVPSAVPVPDPKPASPEAGSESEPVSFYLGVLLAIALLLAAVSEPVVRQGSAA